MRRIDSSVRLISLLLICYISGCTTIVEAPVTSPRTPVKSNKTTPSQSIGGEFHIVTQGDTLYSIAWRYAKDYKNLALWNDIKSPYVIYPGQKVRLKSPPVNTSKPRQTTTTKGKTAAKNAIKKTESRKKSSSTQIIITWRWPTGGKIITLNSPTSQKGVNISGKLGQSIKAAAPGEVVYSGSGLLGYGKLIIIKHNDTYLSAYAHNHEILIKEGMSVAGGQKIATMGIGNQGNPLLHFEIRKDGKPVNPMRYLPKRGS